MCGLSDGIWLISGLVSLKWPFLQPLCLDVPTVSKNSSQYSFHIYAISNDRPVDFEVLVEDSAQNVKSSMTLASASTLSGSAVRTLSVEEQLPNSSFLVSSSLGHLRSQCSIVCGSSLQGCIQGVLAGRLARTRDLVICLLGIWP